MARTQSAFPVVMQGGVSTDGMSLREYFAAHAPSGPLWEFRPKMPPRPNYKRTGANDEDGRPISNHAEVESWDRDYKIQMIAQWPWAWADAVLAARER